RPFRMPVQLVIRGADGFRGFAGMIASGAIGVGDRVRVLPSHSESTAARILVGDRQVDTAITGESATIALADEVDVSRGDVLASCDASPEVADQFEATLVWMHAEPLLQGRSYLMKLATQTVSATVSPIKYKIDVNTFEHLAAKQLEQNDIGVCNLALSRP